LAPDTSRKRLLSTESGAGIALRHQADIDLSRRAIHGTWTSVLILVVLALFTSCFTEQPGLSFTFAFSMALVVGARLWIWRWPDPAAGRSRWIWKGIYVSTILLMALLWGLFYASMVLIYGYGHWTTLVLLICVTGIVSGATTSFAPNLAIMWGFLILLVGPSLLIDAVNGPRGHAMGVLFSGYLAFSMIQGKRRHEEYWRALTDGELLKEKAEELEKARLAAEASNRAKGEFLANISHELRTPMNGVIGMTELTLASDLNPQQRDDLETVKSSAESLLRLLNDLLDYSKIDAGKIELENISFSLRHTIDTALKPLAILARRKGLEFQWRTPDEIPDLLIGDPERLRQILVNLAGNAVKFTEHGSVRVSVELAGGSSTGVELQFTIADTGIGVPADKREIIFEPFSQADGSTTRRFGGSGLGLTISARLAQMIGGRIWMESELGSGSSFFFTGRFALAAGSGAKLQAKTAHAGDTGYGDSPT